MMKICSEEERQRAIKEISETEGMMKKYARRELMIELQGIADDNGYASFEDFVSDSWFYCQECHFASQDEPEHEAMCPQCEGSYYLSVSDLIR